MFEARADVFQVLITNITNIVPGPGTSDNSTISKTIFADFLFYVFFNFQAKQLFVSQWIEGQYMFLKHYAKPGGENAAPSLSVFWLWFAQFTVETTVQYANNERYGRGHRANIIPTAPCKLYNRTQHIISDI